MAQDLRPVKGYIGAELRAPAGSRLAYQTEDFGRRSFADCPVALDAISDARLTAVFAHRQEGDQWYHWGDLWFDVDDKDLRKSAKTAAAIINVLVGLGVPLESIHCYQSGGKGYHIRVPIETFGPDAHELTHCLPTAFKAFTQYIVEAINADDTDGTGHATVDLAVCAGRTAQMLRLPNIPRQNGFYKVPVSHDEVRAVRDAVDAVAMYQAFCSAPRAENWKAEVNEVTGLGDLLKRLALEAVEKQEARVKAAKLLCTEPVDANEITGMKHIDNMVGKILHVGPDGKAFLDELRDYPTWSKVCMAFDYVGCVYDCVAYAHQKFMEISRQAPGWTGPAAVYKRLDSIKHDDAKSHITHRWVFSQHRSDGYKDVNPTAREAYKDKRNARNRLDDVIIEKDKAKQRAMLLDELTVAAYEGCKLSGWHELCAQVDDVAREHHTKREFDKLHREFKAESGNVTDDDLKSDAKFLKWIKTVATFCMDTDGIECIIIDGEAFDLDGGAWLGKLADLWIFTTGCDEVAS